MSSIESPPTAAPPIEGLIERQIGQAMRAYGRRAPMLAGTQSLLALRAIDQCFDALIESARYYGPLALSAADRCLVSAAVMDREGAIFVVSALTLRLPCAEPNRMARLAAYLAAASTPTYWACRLYGDSLLCRQLLDEPHPEMVRLGIQLSGALTLGSLAGQVALCADGPGGADECLLSQVQMGCTPPHFEQHVRAALQCATLGDRLPSSLLQAIGQSGTAQLDHELAQYGRKLLDSEANGRDDPLAAAQRDIAIATWAARRPLEALAVCATASKGIDDTRLRIIALAGHIDGLLPFLRELCAQRAPLTPAQLDVLRMVFAAQLPAGLTIQPGEPALRAGVLRDLACGVFRRNGCSTLKSAQLEGWAPELLSGELWPLAQIRLRCGQPLRQAKALMPAIHVGHRMRAWLYLERAAMTKRTFSLCAEDHAIRQLDALQMIRDLDDVLDHQ